MTLHRLARFRPPDVVADDARLVAALRAGDRDALELLVERFGAPVHTVARCLGGERADELAVRTFVTAWNEAAEPAADGDPAAWIAGILSDVLVDTAAGVGPDGVAGSHEASASAGERATSATDVEAEVERAWVLADTVAGLAETERELVRRRNVDGVAPEHAAEILALEPDTAVTRCVLAHRRLAQRTAHLDDGTDEAGPGERLPVDEVDGPATLAAVVGRPLVALLESPTFWMPVPDGLAELVVAAVGSAEDPADPTADSSAATDLLDVDRTEPAPGPTAARTGAGRQLRAALVGAAATVALLAAGVVAFSATGEPAAVVAFDAELVPTGLVPDVSGTIEVTEIDGGLEIELDAASLPPRVAGSYYEVRLRLADDRVVTAGTFQRGLDVTLTAGVVLDEVVELVVLLGEAMEPGAEPPSDRVVLKADVPRS